MLGTIPSAIMGVLQPDSALLISQLRSSMINNYAKLQATTNREDLDDRCDDMAPYGCLTHRGRRHVVLRSTTTCCFRFVGQKLTTRDPAHGATPPGQSVFR